MGAHVYRQAAGHREGLAAGGAGVGAVARMGAHVYRQAATVRFLDREQALPQMVHS